MKNNVIIVVCALLSTACLAHVYSTPWAVWGILFYLVGSCIGAIVAHNDDCDKQPLRTTAIVGLVLALIACNPFFLLLASIGAFFIGGAFLCHHLDHA